MLQELSGWRDSNTSPPREEPKSQPTLTQERLLASHLGLRWCVWGLLMVCLTHRPRMALLPRLDPTLLMVARHPAGGTGLVMWWLRDQAAREGRLQLPGTPLPIPICKSKSKGQAQIHRNEGKVVKSLPSGVCTCRRRESSWPLFATTTPPGSQAPSILETMIWE